ncbi:MAG: molecular chaperone DnaJ [Candidatus Omnitrophota bacterium]
MSTKRDYYEILGVSKESSIDEIKKSYRQLAMKYHPDRVTSDKRKEAEAQFKEISEAYAVLSDQNKRSQYNQFGHAGIDGRYSSEDIFRGADFSSIFEDFGFGDVFSSFGFGGGTRRSRGGSRRGADLEHSLTLTFEETASGVEKTISIRRREICSTCNGEGAKPGTKKVTCQTCQGQGQVGQSAGFFTIARTCDRCQGQGQIIETPCKDCQGAGMVATPRKIQVKIPAGVDSGAHLRVRGEGEAGTKGGPRGDLYVVIRLKQHDLFERHNNDVYCKMPVSFVTAALGGEIEVPTIYKETVRMKIPAGTQSNKMFRLSGKGFPDLRGHGKGDAYVVVHVAVPVNLTGAQKKLLQEFAKISGEDGNHKSFKEKIKKAFK